MTHDRNKSGTRLLKTAFLMAIRQLSDISYDQLIARPRKSCCGFSPDFAQNILTALFCLRVESQQVADISEEWPRPLMAMGLHFMAEKPTTSVVIWPESMLFRSHSHFPAHFALGFLWVSEKLSSGWFHSEILRSAWFFFFCLVDMGAWIFPNTADNLVWMGVIVFETGSYGFCITCSCTKAINFSFK